MAVSYLFPIDHDALVALGRVPTHLYVTSSVDTYDYGATINTSAISVTA